MQEKQPHENILAKYNETIRRVAGLTAGSEAMKQAMGLGTASEAMKRAMGLGTASEAMKQAMGLGTASEAMKRAMGLGTASEAMKRAMGLGTASEAMKQAMGLGIDSEAMKRAMGLSIDSIAKHYTQYLNPVSAQRALLEEAQLRAPGGLSNHEFARQLVEGSHAFRAVEDAKKILDRWLPTLRDIDASQFEVSEQDEHESAEIAESIAQATTGHDSLTGLIERFALAIQEQPKNHPVQWLLLMVLWNVMDWLISATIGTVMSHYSPMVLGESPQAAKKAVQELARTAVSTPQLLADYRYVSASLLIVRQNPRARSPEVGRLPFGSAVKLIKKENDFTLIRWTDNESGAEVQGWVFSRYLGKFR